MELMNELPCPVLMTSRTGAIIDVNANLLSLVGGDKSLWLGLPMDGLFSLPSRILLQTHLWPMVLHDGQLEEVKLEVVDSQKARVPVLVNCKRTLERGEESYLWVLFVSRERSRYELALLEARNRAEASTKLIEERESALAAMSDQLLATQEKVSIANESGGVGIWDLNLQSGELYWDDIMYRLYGLKSHAGHNAYELWSSHLHPEDRQSAEAAFLQSLATGEDFFSEFRVVWPDGSVHHLRGFGRVRKSESGEPLRIVGTNIEVTESHLQSQALKDARDRAEAANKSKGQFLANMSHEIRTPMNAVLGMLQLAQKTDLDSQQRDYVSKSESAARSLLSLINDILDFSKIEAGMMTLESEPFHIEQLMRSLGVVLSANAGAKNIEVLFDIDPDLPKVVVGDAMRLQQVLINLGGNAVKFTSQGQVTIFLRKLSQTGNSVSLRVGVRDTGIGIAPENQAHIFSDFSQAEGSTTRRFGGTGLGLSICRRIVHLMGGDIQIESTLGLGSTFSFELTLPVASSESVELVVPEMAMAPPRSLVIDDNSVAGPLTLGMLQSLGWDAQLASSGAQALEIIASELGAQPSQFPFAVIYVDWHMPEMDGWQTIERIQDLAKAHQLPVPKVIMVTGGGRETLEQRTAEEQQQLCGFLVKPVTAGMLRDAYAQAFTNKAGLRVASKSRKGRKQLAGMRILVVEDNLINQQVADELLTQEGAIVSLAANGQLGVEAVAAAAPQFDVVLMDIHMPVLDGYGATQSIREGLGLKQLPIIAMTANAMPADRAACFAAGMDEHVSKPFDIAKLVSTLIRLTDLESNLSDPDTDSQEFATSTPLLEVPGLDLATALARLSGMRSLYCRTARDFSVVLDTVVPELQNCVRYGKQHAALMLLHTLKGNAGTLGAYALAAKVGALDQICKSDDWAAHCMSGLSELAPLCESTKSSLSVAVALLAPIDRALPAISDKRVDQSVTIKALQELASLAKASDLQVLQHFAEVRDSISHLPGGFYERLDEALQNLDTQVAHQLCADMLNALHAQPTTNSR